MFNAKCGSARIFVRSVYTPVEEYKETKAKYEHTPEMIAPPIEIATVPPIVLTDECEYTEMF
jgi:hypothetical protein